ncbi:MAG: low molecular weight phosphotyrosine protein phosphatase [Myxococcales bacterium]|nr:low molecular weight phosphotyrosine protein phosphatase [Myxococcales bacterium]MCB9551488.1 low molecular weight phosphotyrosine protein phosphatase [Myxococcales bacterium]
MSAKPTGEPVSVVFVCLGNICRSPLAEGAFRAHVEAAGLGARFVIDSAGTAGYHVGEGPDPRSVAVAKRAGVDISAQRARQLVRDDLGRFDHVVAMDGQNRRDLARLERLVGDRAAVSLLLDEVGGGQVPDPYYGGPEGFDRVWEMVHRATGALLDRIRRERGI